VVVEAAVTPLLLSFAVQAHKRFGTLDPHELVHGQVRVLGPDRWTGWRWS